MTIIKVIDEKYEGIKGCEDCPFCSDVWVKEPKDCPIVSIEEVES